METDAVNADRLWRISAQDSAYLLPGCFEFALDEGIIQRNPAKRLGLPPTRKVCERFLSMEEVHALIGAAAGREKLVLRLFLVPGLRPAELFVLKTEISSRGN